MYVSANLETLTEGSLVLMKQLGVEHLDLHHEVLPTFKAGTHRSLQEFEFERDRDSIVKVIRNVRSQGFRVNSFFAPPLRKALLGDRGGDEQVEDACKFVRLMGQESVPLVDLGLQDVRQGPEGVPGRFKAEHRGGYGMGAFSVALMKEGLETGNPDTTWSQHFRERLTFSEYFTNCRNVVRSITSEAERNDVRLMAHFEDPPIDDDRLLPGFTGPQQIASLLESVGSKSFGLLFCCGTRYESGVDIHEQIDQFGKGGRIFHVHFRNVKGTIPVNNGYEEVLVDEGDMDMFRIATELRDVGYEGGINPDHLPILAGDPDGSRALAYTIAFMKSCIAASAG